MDTTHYTIGDCGKYYTLYKDGNVLIISHNRHTVIRYYYQYVGEPIPEYLLYKWTNYQDISVDKGPK